MGYGNLNKSLKSILGSFKVFTIKNYLSFPVDLRNQINSLKIIRIKVKDNAPYSIFYPHHIQEIGFKR